MPLIGQGRVAQIIEIFQGSDGYTKDNRYGKIVCGVLLEDENQVRYLSSDHRPWFKKIK